MYSGITNIAFISASTLADLNIYIMDGNKISLPNLNWETIDFVPLSANFEQIEAKVNNQKTYSVSFTFQLVCKPEFPKDAIFLITDVNKQMYLIGFKDKPYPNIQCEYSNGIITKRAGYNISVNMLSYIPVLFVI